MEKLGVEPQLLLTQIINFLIILLVLTKLLYKPILKALEERRKKIEEGLAFATKSKEEEEKLELKRQKTLKTARDEAKVIIENAKKEARIVKEEMINEGKKELEDLRIKLEREAKTKEQEIAAEITSHTVDIATEMVKRLLPDLIKEDKQHHLIQKELEKIEKKI